MDLDKAPESVFADHRQLKQILYNLLSNAVKFTPGGGKITVRAEKYAWNSQENEGIRIEVADTGMGINPWDLERIFSPFEQVEASATRRFQGTGLGLSLTRRLVELHGGTIRADSRGEGKGSCFAFVLPR